ncbi:MAG TPA: Asp23/Gls24 family envelope stress response protein [Ktedonobacterales bacterium]
MTEPHTEPTTNRQNASTTTSRSSSTVDAQTQLVPAAMGEAVLLNTEHGKTVIADSVVAKIAGAAAREIDGVHDLIPMSAGAIAGIAGRFGRSDQRSTGVSVEVGQREAAIDLNMTVEYGVSIPEVAEAVRQNIIERVRGMSGLIVKEVNINAADLYFPGEEAAPPRVQ